MQSVYIWEVHEIIPQFILLLLETVWVNVSVYKFFFKKGRPLRMKTFEVCYLTAKSNVVVT